MVFSLQSSIGIQVRRRVFDSDVDRTRILECETALISLLLMIFEILRAQMGAELVHNILQTTFAAFNM